MCVCVMCGGEVGSLVSRSCGGGVRVSDMCGEMGSLASGRREVVRVSM